MVLFNKATSVSNQITLHLHLKNKTFQFFILLYKIKYIEISYSKP